MDNSFNSSGSSAEQSLLYLNYYDEFIEKSREVMQSAPPNKRFAVLYTDITDFQTVNTFYGFAEGDRMLAAFANFLNTAVNAYVCGRIFSDHFLCLFSIRSADSCRSEAERFRDSLNCFLQKQRRFHPNCKLHIACGMCRTDAANLVTAVDNANTARKRSKSRSSTAVLWFDERLRSIIRLEEQDAQAAQAALREQRYCFFLQPKVNLHTGQIVGAEALARAISRSGQLIPPDHFIPYLEQNGSIIEMDFSICQQVCEYLAARLAQGLPVVTISVNLSRLHVHRSNTAKALHEMVSSYHIPPYLLEFELTETLLLDEFDGAKHLIDALRNYGYKVSIDDFGSGYAGINVWQELNFDLLKLDKKFLSDDPKVKVRNDALIPNLIRIANQLQTTVLCEGAETAEQCEYLDSMGCSIVQGYYFSKPLSCSDFDRMFEKNHGTFPIDIDHHPYSAYTQNLEMCSINNSIFDIVPGGLAGFSKAGQLLFVSSGLENFTGYPIQDLFSLQSPKAWFRKFIEPDELPQVYQCVQWLQQSDRIDAYIHIRHADGHIIPLRMYAGKIHSPDWGNYILCCFIDASQPPQQFSTD